MSNRTRPQVELAATCACGAVHIAVAGVVHVMLLCSCEDCQKATGAGHSAAAFVDATDVTIAGLLKSFARPADSGAILTRYFCPDCGTPIYGQSSRALRFMMLQVGLFGAETEWFEPNQLIFARSHRQWDDIAADLARHETYRQKATL